MLKLIFGTVSMILGIFGAGSMVYRFNGEKVLGGPGNGRDHWRK